MGRLRLGALTAVTLLGVADPAAAAEITRIASSGEPNDAFDLHLSIRFDREQERAQIGREVPGPSGTTIDGEALRYTRKRGALVPRVAVGLWRDLELHAELPYVLYDDRYWRYGVSPSVDPAAVLAGSLDLDGQICAPSCPAPFPVDPKGTTLYHGGRAGDLTTGLAWGIFNDKKDDTKPFWLVGLDVTFPTAALWEPANSWLGSPWINTQSAHPAPFGEKIWKYDLYTALSRRLGAIDPYFKAHATLMTTSNETYSNCKYATELSQLPTPQMSTQAAANCKLPSWSEDAGARLPWIAGVLFGTEIVPFEDPAQQQKVTLDVRLWADYKSSQRFYNELTDMTGKLHETEGYATLGGSIALYLRASKYVSVHAKASLATESSHLLTGESLGRNGTWPALPTGPSATPGVPTDPALLNPNFDWRYDAPGSRFRLSEVSVFDLSIAGVLEF